MKTSEGKRQDGKAPSPGATHFPTSHSPAAAESRRRAAEEPGGGGSQSGASSQSSLLMSVGS
ncbi:MAG: hypothetical protein H6559_37965 [Lewinellaceae bacterium]|nr:hypothetical protein [Lewinellaceae bacterium]